MNIVIISFGHVDPGSALAKYLCKSGNIVSYILVGTGNRFTNSIVDFDISKLSYGLHNLSILEKQTQDTSNLIKYLRGVKSYFIKMPSKSLHDLSNIKYIRELSNFVDELKPDVIHYNGDSALQLVFYYFLRKYASIYTIHDLIPHSGESSKRNLKNNFLRWIHYNCNYQFILHSEYYSDMMKKITSVNPKNINTIYFAPFDVYNYYINGNIENESPSVLFFGRISKYKGLRYLFEAIPLINKNVPDCEYFILGKGKIDDINNSDFFCKEYNVKIINNYIDNQTLSNYLQKCSLVVLPYTDATQSAVIFTAYAFNKPVVASHVGGIPEVVIDGKTGYLSEPCNSKQLAEKITEMLIDKGKLKRFSDNIKEYRKTKEIRFLNWEICANETQLVYEKAIKEKSS